MTAPRPRPPAALPRHARAMLAAYREAHEIPPEAEDRIWSVVGADDAPAPAFDPWDEPTARRPERRPDRRWTTWAAASLAAAAVLALAWQLGGSLAQRREPARTPGAAVMQGAPSPQGRAASVPSPRASTHASPDSAPHARTSDAAAASPTPDAAAPRSTPGDASDRARPLRPDPSTRARPSTPPEPKPEPASTSTLAAERELVAQAWRALALGDEPQALEATADHARRFPAGLLGPERDAIETIARCRQDADDGPRRATAFHRAHPRSPLGARVDEACATKAPTHELPRP